MQCGDARPLGEGPSGREFGPVLDEEVRDVGVAVLRGDVERRHADVLVEAGTGVNGSPGTEKTIGDRPRTFLGCHVQCRVPVVVNTPWTRLLNIYKIKWQLGTVLPVVKVS